jgi:hypothetical protein
MSLPERDALLLFRRETDEANFDRFDADAAQHELPIDDVADVRVDDLAVSVERSQRTGREAERADVLIRERRRSR